LLIVGINRAVVRCVLNRICSWH